MDLEKLDGLFKIGRIFALTPSAIDNKIPNLFQKCYQILTFVVYTVCFIVTNSCIEPYYDRFIPMFKVLFVSLKISYYAHSVYVLIVLMVMKRHLWFKLIHNLQCVDHQVDFQRKSFWLIIVVAHLVFWVIALFEIYIYFLIFDLTYAGANIFECFENYSLFFYAISACVVLSLLLSRYKHQILLLKKRTINIKKVKNNIRLLKESVDIFNNIFGWVILSNTFYGALKCLMYINIMVKHEYVSKNLLLQLHMCATLLLIWAGILGFVMMCDAVLK
ncbi:hypothetical protein BDFB_014008, partial [Asbolus verrucosus]